MDMQLIFPGHTVDLRDRIMLIQYLCDLRQTAWRCFDLKIAGYLTLAEPFYPELEARMRKVNVAVLPEVPHED